MPVLFLAPRNPNREDEGINDSGYKGKFKPEPPLPTYFTELIFLEHGLFDLGYEEEDPDDHIPGDYEGDGGEGEGEPPEYEDEDEDMEQGQDGGPDGTNLSRSPSPSAGEKRSHSPSGAEYQWRKPVKVHATTGAKPKAGDYEVAVQKILGEAIALFRGYLSNNTPYPNTMEELRWAKKSWKDSCGECEARILYNPELIKLVSWTSI
jgi:hypothetical protein